MPRSVTGKTRPCKSGDGGFGLDLRLCYGAVLRSVAPSSDRDRRAELLLQIRKVRLGVDRRAGRASQQLLGRVFAALRVDVQAEPLAQRGELAPLDLLFEVTELLGSLLPDLHGHHGAEEVCGEVADETGRPVHVLEQAAPVV